MEKWQLPQEDSPAGLLNKCESIHPVTGFVNFFRGRVWSVEEGKNTEQLYIIETIAYTAQVRVVAEAAG